MVLGKLFLGCAGGQTFKERVCAQMCSAANERNFTLLSSASSSLFILLPLKPLELDVVMSAGPSLSWCSHMLELLLGTWLPERRVTHSVKTSSS